MKYFIGLLFALAANTAFTEEQDQDYLKKEKDIRWEAMAPIANMLLNEEDSDAYVAAGNQEKAQFENYPGALVYYLMATRMDNKNIMGPYQAAGTLAISGMSEHAMKYLKLADERGVWQWLLIRNDSEFESIKNLDEYKAIMKRVESRYQEHSKDAGMARFAIPAGKIPKQGWPVVVWLSGYGTEGADSLDMAATLLKNRAVWVAINGTEKLDEESFRWSMSEVGSTHKVVQRAIDDLERTIKIDRQNIALMGFSQGAQHAAHLIARYPKEYSGALILSPGGPLNTISEPAPKDKRIAIQYGKNEHAGNIDMSKKFIKYFERTNKVKYTVHEGAHHFDKEWERVYPASIQYILGLESN